MAQATIDQAYQIAVRHHESGQLRQAEAIYRQILAQKPRHAGAMYCLGLIALVSGRSDVAVDLIRQAVALSPKNPDAYNNLGLALMGIGQIDEAIAGYRRAITLNPNFPLPYNNLGIALEQKGQGEEAVAAFRKAIALKPDFPEAYNNLGNALRARGQLDEALPCFRRAIAIKPDYPQAHMNLGNTLGATGHLEEAIAACRQAIALMPNYPEAYSNLGVALAHKGELDEAIAAYRRAIELNPNLAAAYDDLGNVLKDMGQQDQSFTAYRQAIALAPNHQAHSNLLYALHFQPGGDAQAIASEHFSWNRQHAEPCKRFIPSHANDRNPERPLRIGYVSADLHEHSVAFFLESLLAHHDAGAVETFCYADVVRPDQTTARLERFSNQWRNIVGHNDADVARKVQEDGIDILIDLSGHTARNRLLVFARKPAPVQATYLGYPDTTGLTAMDYRLTDAYADPPGTTESLHSERLVRLPDAFLCYRPSEAAPTPGPVPSLVAERVTFGSFNAMGKLNAPLAEMWARILNEVPDSRLILKSRGLANAGVRQHLLQYFADNQIDPNRIELIDRIASEADHLRLYSRIDVALDTFPYHGTTTSCEAMWMGVPVVSLAGKTHVSRVGVSLLTNVGMAELIADTPQSYVQLASELAQDRARLSRLRSELRQRMQQSPLMDAPRFARNVEAAYRQMWRRWCEGESGNRS
jgi:predicted O-linked N-acetylglucosamine transferase (SPINDLY family)